VRRFTVAVDENTAERLLALARAERRDPREQAALLLEGVLAGLNHRTDVPTRIDPDVGRAALPRGHEADGLGEHEG
jgi:hypothetical protein